MIGDIDEHSVVILSYRSHEFSRMLVHRPGSPPITDEDLE